MNKYRNIKTKRGNITFDSQLEANRYDELMLLFKADKIRDLKLQPTFTLQEAFTTPDGEHVKAITYKADFSYDRQTEPDCTGTTYWLKVVEDAKGVKTEAYKIKKKMLINQYPSINFREITR